MCYVAHCNICCNCMCNSLSLSMLVAECVCIVHVSCRSATHNHVSCKCVATQLFVEVNLLLFRRLPVPYFGNFKNNIFSGLSSGGRSLHHHTCRRVAADARKCAVRLTHRRQGTAWRLASFATAVRVAPRQNRIRLSCGEGHKKTAAARFPA